MAEDKQQVTNPDPDSATNKFVGIPIADLVAAPFVAVSDSQKKLAQSAFEFMQEIGFNEEGKTRMVEFNLQKPIDGSITPQEEILKVPNLHIDPLPNLSVQNVQVDFQMEVTSVKTSRGEKRDEHSVKNDKE